MSTENNIEKAIEIVPLGSDEKISLSIKIVQNLIAVKSRSGQLPDTNQCMKFIMLCKAKHLNPFEGDAYLLGYDSREGGTTWSQITAHQVFLKRAEASEYFDGMESGVILKTDDGIEERQGDLVLDGEVLVGGWAKVYRKDREYEIYRRLNLKTFSTGLSRWAKDPAGMIVKCAEADALRSAFPTHLGGLYMMEEREPIDITPAPIPRPTFTPTPLPLATKIMAEEAVKQPKKGRKKEPEVTLPTALDHVRDNLKRDGFTEDDLMTVATQLQWTQEMALADVPEKQLLQWISQWDEVKIQLGDYKAVKEVEKSKTTPEQHQDALFK